VNPYLPPYPLPFPMDVTSPMPTQSLSRVADKDAKERTDGRD
jgi:hypothetical protein